MALTSEVAAYAPELLMAMLQGTYNTATRVKVWIAAGLWVTLPMLAGFILWQATKDGVTAAGLVRTLTITTVVFMVTLVGL